MNKQTNWISTKVRTGWFFLGAGIVVGMIGLLAQLRFGIQPYNTRIITGVGIFLAGVGIANIVRYRGALKDEQSARRVTADERDERIVQIRNRAGNRAFLVSVSLTYVGLMWASFADRGELPSLTGDTLWYYLAATVLISFAVYIGGILIDQGNS
jgi:ABC-type uncharacterized transport system permease subunit